MAGGLRGPQVHTFGEDSDCGITQLGVTLASSGSTSPSFPSPRSVRQTGWAAQDADVFFFDGGAASGLEAQKSLEGNLDDGADIAEWIATSCILDESEEPASQTQKFHIVPPPVSSQSGNIEQLSVRTKEAQLSPWLGAVKGNGGSASVGSTEGSSSEISRESSQEGSPTSVLGKAGSQAWDLLFAAAGEVQKLAQGQDSGVQGKSTWKVPPGTSVESRPMPASNATWMRNGAASMGLTAGAAAPLCLNKPKCETGRTLPGKPGWQQVSNMAGRVPARCVKAPGVPVSPPAPAALASHTPVTGFSPSSRLPAPRSLHADPRYSRGLPRPPCQAELPPVKRLPQPQQAPPPPPPPGPSYNGYCTPRFGPLGPPPFEMGLRRAQFAQFGGLRGATPDEPLHAVVLGHSKDQNSGTGVFLPRATTSGSSETSGAQVEEGNGGHSTTVLLPARLIHSLGLNINTENSVVVNRHPRQAPPPPAWHSMAPQNGQRRNFGPYMRMPRPVQPGFHFPPHVVPAVYGGPLEAAPLSHHSWEAAPANCAQPYQHAATSGGASASLYENLPSEWAY